MVAFGYKDSYIKTFKTFLVIFFFFVIREEEKDIIPINT